MHIPKWLDIGVTGYLAFNALLSFLAGLLSPAGDPRWASAVAALLFALTGVQLIRFVLRLRRERDTEGRER